MSSRTRNLLWYARMLATGGCFAAASVGTLPVFIARARNTANNGLFVRTLAKPARKILGFKVEHRGRAIIDNAMPCVFIMNHQAALDILVNAELYPDRCVLIAKKPLLFIPVFGWLLYLAGNLLLDKKDRKHSLARMQEADIAIQEKGLSIWIFPEGTRSYNAGLGKFKKGAFHCAIKNQVPIVPVAVSSYHKAIDFSRKNAGTVIIEALEPISTEGMTDQDVDILIEKAWHAMNAAIERLDAEISERSNSAFSEK